MHYMCAVPTKGQKGASNPLELRLQPVTWFLTSEPSHDGCCCYYLGTGGLPTIRNALSTCSKHLPSPSQRVLIQTLWINPASFCLHMGTGASGHNGLLPSACPFS